MKRNALKPVHIALQRRLSQDGPLNEIITGVYESPRFDSVMPWVVINEPTTNNVNYRTRYADSITFVLNLYSKSPSKLQAYDMIDLVQQALSKQPLSLEGGFSMSQFQMGGVGFVNEPNMPDIKRAVVRVQGTVFQTKI